MTSFLIFATNNRVTRFARGLYFECTTYKVTKKRQNEIWWWGLEQVMESARTIFSPFFAA